MKIVAMTFSLFLLMDAVGNIPFFISFLKDIPQNRQHRIIVRELLIALVVMVLFNYVGDFFLNALQVTEYSVLLSGSIILFLIALKMIFHTSNDLGSRSRGEKEPFIVPLAIPLVAGPAVLAAIILYSKETTTSCLIAILCAWIVTTPILLLSSFLHRVLGKRGLIACQRLMGLVLTIVSVQMFLEGVAQYFAVLHAS